MPKNPYPKLPGEVLHAISARISPSDFQYMRQLFPCRNGIQDAIVSTLYKALVDELKSRGLKPSNPDDSAWSTNHPSYSLLDDILRSVTFERAGFRGGGDDFCPEPQPSELERCPVGIHPPQRNLGGRPTCPRDDPPATRCLYSEMCYIASKCTDPEGCTAGGEWRNILGGKHTLEEKGEEKE